MNIQHLSSSSDTQPVVPAKVSHHLTGDVALPIHTKKAQSLCQGAWKYKEMGLFQFAKVMSDIYQSTEEDDPYGDWYTDKIKKELLAANKAIKTAIAGYKEALQQCGLEVQIFGSQRPLRLLLEFRTPLSYVAAYTIVDLDYLLRQVFTLKRLGMLGESDETSYRLFWAVKSVLAKCRLWRRTGVTRQDIRDNNQKAQHAKKLMGKLPLRILNQKSNRRQEKAATNPVND